MTDRCPCKCHDPATEDGVLVTDVIEAVTACPSCLNDHCPALLDQPPPRIPMGDISTAYVDSYTEPEKGAD